MLANRGHGDGEQPAGIRHQLPYIRAGGAQHRLLDQGFVRPRNRIDAYAYQVMILAQPRRKYEVVQLCAAAMIYLPASVN